MTGECGPVERLEAEMRELSGRVELLRSRAGAADAEIHRMRRSILCVITAGVMLTVAVVILAAAR